MNNVALKPIILGVCGVCVLVWLSYGGWIFYQKHVSGEKVEMLSVGHEMFVDEDKEFDDETQDQKTRIVLSDELIDSIDDVNEILSGKVVVGDDVIQGSQDFNDVDGIEDPEEGEYVENVVGNAEDEGAQDTKETSDIDVY